MSASTMTRSGARGTAVPAPTEPDWFDGLVFQGPLDPGGTLFAFLLALAATVGLVVLVAGAVRVTGLG